MRFWVLCMFYEPFVMGGDVWQKRRYEVEADVADSIDGFETFAWTNEDGDWQVHERTTGGLLGKGETLHEAWSEAKGNVRETPDLAKQIKEAGPIMSHQAVSYEEATRRLKKTASEEKARKANKR